MTKLLLLLCVFSMSICGAADFSENSLKDEMVKMQKILETNTIENAKLFIDTYCDPADLAKISESGKTVEQVYAQFVERAKGERMRKCMKETESLVGVISGDDKTITYKVESGVRGQIKFKFIDGKWYLVN